MRPAYLLELPLTDYIDALKLQHTAVEARHTGRLEHDLVILLEHPSVFTLGRRGGKNNLLVSEQWLAEKGILIVPIERGGDITYHGPGQLVAYPIVDLNRASIKVVDFVDALENAMIQTALQWDVGAYGDRIQRGAWVRQRKLGSVGITVRRGISFHGLALNVHTDLTPFDWINPCGIQACRMTTLALETGQSVEMDVVRQELARQLENILSLEFQPIGIDELEVGLSVKCKV
jgi:lipoyl(octanoyl) transferase